MTAKKLQSRAKAMVALLFVALALAAGGCASGANSPGEVNRAFDAKSRRWVSTMTPVEIEVPPRQADIGYKRPKMSSQKFVPKIY